MIEQKVRDSYKVTIGIECHVQLKTKTKLFSGSINDSTTNTVNHQTNHIDFGLPGALPFVNREAITLAIRAGYALNTEAQVFSKFDRKHYFYPDLPMGYQITQFEFPILKGGYVEIISEGQIKKIEITRAHLEADAGKSTHPAGANYSLVDLNRAGAPLLEIVSEPQMHTSAEAKEYCFNLYLAMKFAKVSDVNLFYGNMRFDVNVSVSKTDDLGTRTETKNLNSFRAVEKSIDYEVIRQIEILEKGGQIRQETRGWNDAKQVSFTQRIKENADDYRYMPDPDIPPIIITKDELLSNKKTMPVSAQLWRNKLISLGLELETTNLLLLAEADYDSSPLSLIDQAIDETDKAKTYANWIMNIELPLLERSEEAGENLIISSQTRQNVFEAAYSLKTTGQINSTKLTELIGELLISKDKISDILQWAKDSGYLQNSNQDELAVIVKSVIQKNPKVVNDILLGETKAVGFLVGQIMKETKGQANPQIVNQLISQEINLLK